MRPPEAVLLLGARPPPSGGIASHLTELAQALVDAAVPVRVVDPRRRGPDGPLRLLSALARARLHGDLVHVHENGHNPKSWVLAGLAAGPRSVLTVHSGLAPAFCRAHAPALGRVVCAYAHVIAVNAEIAAALAECGVAPARLTVTPAFSASSLAFHLPPPGLAAIRRAHPLLLACALAPGREYGAEVMLAGFARVHARQPAAGLVLYGPGTRDPALAAAVHRHGLAGSVYLYGELARARALGVVAAADLFVRPTLADGDALSVREALALGRPVVASTAGARPPAACLFAAGDAAALAEAIFRTLGNPGLSSAPPPDGVAATLQIYGHLGLVLPPATIGTPLVTTDYDVDTRSTKCVALPAV